MRDVIFQQINDERDRQDAKWGPLPRNLSGLLWLGILMEEVGEVAKSILEKDWIGFKMEIIQVMAVCVAWLEDREYSI